MYLLTLDDYEITKDGKVIRKYNNKERKLVKNSKGYLRVLIGKRMYFAHRLVAQKYVPNLLNKPQVNHIDGNKLNNNYLNLEWVTNLENRQHAVKNHLHICGEKCKNSKLTQKDVDFIRNNSNISNTILAKKFNVARSTINSIKKFRTWNS